MLLRIIVKIVINAGFEPLLEGLRIETINLNEDINQRKCIQVKNCIDSYLSKRPNLNLQSIEDKTTVAYTTLRRIHTLKGNPQPETVIRIFNALGEDELLYIYMNEFHPDIAKVMNMNFSHNQEYKFVDEKSRSYFTSEDYFLILNLASTNSGTTAEEVSHHLGTVGIERLNHLVSDGLIIADKNDRFIGANHNFKLSFAETKKRIEMSMKHYRLDEAGSIHNWMSFQTESTNVDGLKALKKLNQKHFNERKDQIYNNPMYNGDIKHYTASVSSTFLPYAEEGDLQ